MKFADFKEVGKKYEIGGGWMALEEGDNKIRLISEFEDYGTHYSRNKSTVCIGKDKGCYECKKGSKPKVQFLGWVIDRKDGRIKLLRIGYQIYEQIGVLASSEEYTFSVVPNYDITIRRTGQGLETKYAVVPDRKDNPLTEEEKEQIKAEIKRGPEEIVKQMKDKVIPVIDELQPGEEADAIDNIPY